MAYPPKFFTSTGWLTQYSLTCGYIHVSEYADRRVSLELNNAAMDTYDVKVYYTNNAPRVWETVEGINKARALYKKFCDGKPLRRDRKSYENKIDVPATLYA